MNKTESIEDKISQMQNQYYEKNGGKSWFQKTQQKMDCAVSVSEKIPLNDLFCKTFYVAPNTNHVYMDYTLFKTFANPSINDQIIQYILKLFTECIETYGSFEVHINLKSFTMTAAQRYRDIICQFCNECLAKETQFTLKLNCVSIYNSPKMIDAISSLFSGFIDEQTRTKIRIL